MIEIKDIGHGEAFPLGATLSDRGVNFSVFAPHAERVELLLFRDEFDVNPQKIVLDPDKNRTYAYWHIFVSGLKENQFYGYRLDGEYNPSKGLYFDPSKVLVDPYAKMICGDYDRNLASQYGISNLHSCLKSAIINDKFDWGENNWKPRGRNSDSIVYELHVAGFTKNPNSGLEEGIRGTYSGLIEKIPYLKSLGITSVELLPVYAFDPQDAPGDNYNYWGYSPINFFALHAAYSSKRKPQEVIDEFKSMIKVFHENEIEVILDVVYNHTTENDAFNEGPTVCLRGFANNAYYLMDENKRYRNYSGTGNSINANHSVVRRMILDSLHYWVREMKVDGFRFDLASELSRGENGNPMMNSPILWSIDSDPILANVKIIAEPWDAAGLHQVRDFSGERWMIWNDDYRDTVKGFVSGRNHMVSRLARKYIGSYGEINARNSNLKPEQSLNFVSCHDGFTMRDSVSYNAKNNWANGEGNRDGHDDMFTWNSGMEGETSDSEVLALRDKQQRNLFSILLLSQGTPMFFMGDEVARSQKGNNNAYSQDNPIGWMDWDLVEKNADLLEFVQRLIAVRKEYLILNNRKYWSTIHRENVPYINFHGVKLYQPDYSPKSHSLSCEMVDKQAGEHLFLIMNMYWEKLDFELPKEKWYKVFDTESDFKVPLGIVGESIEVPPRSVTLLSTKEN